LNIDVLGGRRLSTSQFRASLNNQTFRYFLKSLMHNMELNTIGSAFQTNGAALQETLSDSTVLLKGAASKELFEDLSDQLHV